MVKEEKITLNDAICQKIYCEKCGKLLEEKIIINDLVIDGRNIEWFCNFDQISTQFKSASYYSAEKSVYFSEKKLCEHCMDIFEKNFSEFVKKFVDDYFKEND